MPKPYNHPTKLFPNQIDWPNGRGCTPCSNEYYNTLQEQAALTAGGRGLESLSPADYQRWNELDSALMTMQASGEHLGKSVTF